MISHLSVDIFFFNSFAPKEKKPKIPRKNHYRRRLRRWHSDTGKYTQPTDTAVWMHYLDANKTAGEEAWQQLHKNAASNIEQVLEATPHKTPTIRPPASHHENYPS